MRQVFQLLLLFSVAIFSMDMGGYVNRELGTISFTDSLILSSVSIDKQFSSGSQGPIPDDDDTGKVSFNYKYSYDSIKNEIQLLGAGSAQIYKLDDQKRVTRINEGTIRTTTFEYKQNETIIKVYPNASGEDLSKHTFGWRYLFNDNGTVHKAIFTPVDWEYQGPIEWAPTYEDTIAYSYDSSGKRIGARRIFWDTNLFHSVPWRKTEDSVTYTYDSVYTGTDSVMARMTVEMLSPFGTGWQSLKGDTQWVYLYNDDGQIFNCKERRWDAALSEWDQLYYFNTDYEYEDSLLVSKYKWLIYGDGSKTLLNRSEDYVYGLNTIKYGTPDVSNSKVTLRNGMKVNIVKKGNLLTFKNVDKRLNEISIYSISGRLISSVKNATAIDLRGVNLNQQLIIVAKGNNNASFKAKVLLK